MAEIGIIVGRPGRAEILDAFLRAGHDLVVTDPARGAYAAAGRHAHGGLRIHDDEAHFTFRALCPMPHAIVEVCDDPRLVATMRRVVAGYGGYLRDARGKVTPAPTPEGENPGFDLLRGLDAVEGLDHRARDALARLAQADPEAFRALARTLSTHAEGFAPTASAAP